VHIHLAATTYDDGPRGERHDAGIAHLVAELARAAARDVELALVVLTPATAPREPAWPVDPRSDLDRFMTLTGATRLDAATIAVPLPGHDERAAMARAAELVHGTGLAAGVALAHIDGLDVHTLVDAARAAADRTAASTAGRAADAVERLALGPHVALVADPGMADIYALTRRLARAGVPVSIHGETGSGKELIAAALHAFSPRATGPFVAINCAAIPEGMAEAELFGHARGAFTGACAARPGHFEAASGGTLFLDEIAELSPSMQARLLRVLDAGELRRLGESAVRQVDVRVICASHVDLRAEVDAGRFRRELYYRLGPSRIEVPPLRERPRDLAALIRGLVADACARAGRRPVGLAPATGRALLGHSWPGNVRELRHVIEYAVAAAEDARELLPCHLPPRMLARAQIHARPAAAPASSPDEIFRPLAEEVQELERRRMVEALRAAQGVHVRAAQLIDMPSRTFATKLKRYAIGPGEWRTGPDLTPKLTSV
jgi:DNA-binding NtrC family response regulator